MVARWPCITYITLVSPSTSLQICCMFSRKTLTQPWRYLISSQFWWVGASTSFPLGNPHWRLMPLPLCSHQVIVCLSAFFCEGNWSALLRYSSACPHISPLRIQLSQGLTDSTQPSPLGNWSCLKHNAVWGSVPSGPIKPVSVIMLFYSSHLPGFLRCLWKLVQFRGWCSAFPFWPRSMKPCALLRTFVSRLSLNGG